MILSSDNLWRHVAWSTTCVLVIVTIHDHGDAQISQPKVSFGVEYQVFRFDVSMYNTIGVQILQSEKDTTDKELDNMFWESFESSNLVSE